MPVVTTLFRPKGRGVSQRSLAAAIGAALLLGCTWSGGAAGNSSASAVDTGTDTPSIQYQEAMAHASDPNTFTPGAPVSVPYTPRAGDRTVVDGALPVALPAGQGADEQAAPLAGSQLSGAGTVSPAGTTNALRREVYGFLPYWRLGDTINYDVVSTIAYFGTDLNTDGTLDTASTGWAGWQSSTMTGVINTANANHVRVAITIESFAWGSAGAAAQTALLSNPTAVTTAVQQIAAAVHDRGAGGVNLDFEPIAPGMSDNYVKFVRQLRAQLDSVQPGYELTFCGTGRPSTYDLGDLLADGAADDVFIMGYDFRDGGSSYAASLDPLTSPKVYDLTDSVNVYKANVPVSKIILGLPYYGIAYSTPNSSLYAANVSGATYGDAVMVPYYTAADIGSVYPSTYIKQYDSIEQSAWASYYGTFGGTQPTWRELYYDDVQALGARYDMVNYWNLRGVGMWTLGYDEGHPELNQLLADKFLTDHNPPKAGIVDLPPVESNQSFTVSWTGRDDWNGVANYDVQVSLDGGPFADWLIGTTATSSSFDGVTGHNYSFRVRATDGVGNVGSWDLTATYTASPTFAVGGFATVVGGTANERSSPAASAGIIKTAASGTVFQIIGGPVSADGYTWYQVTGPITELSTVTPPFPGAWIAATNDSTVFMAPSSPPNSTVVSAAISNIVVGTPGQPPSQTGIDAGRTFSPDGDGIRDHLPLSWTNTAAFDDVTVTVYRADNSVAGVIDLGGQAAGAQSYSWNGTSDGTTQVPDGQYLLQIQGTVAGSTYYGPSAAPFDAAAWSNFGVIVDTTASGTYYPLTPTRILDTRIGTGLGGAFAAGKSRAFAVAGQGNVPSGAIAVTGNVTITNSSSQGWLRLGSTTAGTSSTINFLKGDTRANGVTLGLAGDGSLSGLYVTPSGSGTVQVIFDLTGYFLRNPGGATFIPMAPTRLVDTRTKSGLTSPLVARSVATFQVGGRSGVPANATAVTGNATVVGQTSNGYITLAPAIGAGQPTSSTLNFPKGDIRANNLTVPLNSAGQLQVEYWGNPGQSTQFVFDVTGYFVPGLSGATFVPLAPGRVVDSRISQGFKGPLRMTTSTTFAVRGQVSVHLAAVAVVGNLTVTNQTAAGWLNAAPTATSATSTLNFPVGDNRANGFVSMLGPGGSLSVTYGGSGSSATTQVVVDILGYYR